MTVRWLLFAILCTFGAACGDAGPSNAADVNGTTTSSDSNDQTCTDCDPCDSIECREGWLCQSSPRGTRCVCPEGTVAMGAECVEVQNCGDGTCVVGTCTTESGAVGQPPVRYCECTGGTTGDACDQCPEGTSFSDGSCRRDDLATCDCPPRYLCSRDVDGSTICTVGIDGL